MTKIKSDESEAVPSLGTIVLLLDGIVVKTLDATEDDAPFRFDHEGIAFERFVANTDGASYYRPVEPVSDAHRKTLLAMRAKTDSDAIQAKADADLAAIKAKADADLAAIKGKTASTPEPKAEPKAESKRDSRF